MRKYCLASFLVYGMHSTHFYRFFSFFIISVYWSHGYTTLELGGALWVIHSNPLFQGWGRWSKEKWLAWNHTVCHLIKSGAQVFRLSDRSCSTFLFLHFKNADICTYSSYFIHEVVLRISRDVSGWRCFINCSIVYTL